MKVRQISIFLENRPGRILEVAEILGEAGINIRAMSLADTSDFGIIRLIVNQPDRAVEILRAKEFTVRENEVIATEVADRPGGLAQLLRLFSDAGISIEYMYGFISGKPGTAIMILRVEAEAKALKTLQDAGMRLVTGEEIYSI